MEKNFSLDSNTLENLEEEGLKYVRNYLQKFYSLWKNFGIDEEQRVERGKVVWKHLLALLDDICNEEISFYEDIKERIRNYTKKIEELSKALNIALKEETSESLIKKEENLRQELDVLTKLKHKRLKSYQDLRSVESSYCSLLGIEQHKLAVDLNGVPSENELREIQQHINMLKEERDRRYKKLCFVKRELTIILETTELTPENPLAKEILSGIENISLKNDTLKALEEVVCEAQRKKTQLEKEKEILVDKLKALWDRLKVPDSEKVKFLSQHMDCKVSTLNSIKNELEKCEKLKKDNLKKYVDTLRDELKHLWDKCYVSESERNQLEVYYTNEMTDEVLEAHEAEVEKWKLYYEEVKNILIKIEKRKELWELMIVFENKASDPNRFKNRKGNLLKEEKERKKLQKDLPALENEIFVEIDLYESVYHKKLKYYGEDYQCFVTNQWQERINQKENEKIERHKQRLLTENETALKTPSKRTLLTSPKSAPSKFFKSGAGMSIYRTPVNNKSRVMPSTTGKSLFTPLKSHITSKLVNSNQKSNIKTSAISRPKAIKKRDQDILRERNRSKNSSDSTNAPTYSAFATDLDSSSRYNFRSSVLSTKKAGGTRISMNNSKNNRKSASKSLRKSIKNISKTTQSLTPARGKLGLPFLI